MAFLVLVSKLPEQNKTGTIFNLNIMNDKNFHCNNCEKDFFVSRFKSVFRNGKLVLEKKHQCDYCKSYNTEQKSTPKRIYKLGDQVNYGKFSSASDEEKKRILKKRADDHYNKQGKEQKRELFKNTMRKMGE